MKRMIEGECSSGSNVYADPERRTIYFYDSVNATSIGLIVSTMQTFITMDDEMEENQINFKRQPIHLYINSSGGTLYDMWSLVDTMLMTKTPIYTYCTGYAISAAFILFICGDRRFITPHATLMCHQLSTTQDGTYLDLVQNFDELTWMQTNVEQLICGLTKIPKKIIHKIRTEKLDYYIHAKEALEFEVADYLIGAEFVEFVDTSLTNEDNKKENKPKKKKSLFEKFKK